MPLTTRLVIALLLLFIAGFCGFGFLASFESPEFMGWRIGYTLIGVLCLVGVGWVLFAKRRPA